ncbi:MAG: hypothetical protein KDK70_21245 [Myxococcales bacterium]|nr:hypothetical protein [Myxococcales bacterium]
MAAGGGRRRRGDLTRAEAVLQQTRRAQDEAGFAPDNAYRGLELRLHGDLRLARGDVAGAKATYRRACATLAVPASPHDPELAACRLALARALGQGTEAQALARRARDAYRALGEGFAAERAEAQALLDAPAHRLAAAQ